MQISSYSLQVRIDSFLFGSGTLPAYGAYVYGQVGAESVPHKIGGGGIDAFDLTKVDKTYSLAEVSPGTYVFIGTKN